MSNAPKPRPRGVGLARLHSRPSITNRILDTARARQQQRIIQSAADVLAEEKRIEASYEPRRAGADPSRLAHSPLQSSGNGASNEPDAEVICLPTRVTSNNVPPERTVGSVGSSRVGGPKKEPKSSFVGVSGSSSDEPIVIDLCDIDDPPTNHVSFSTHSTSQAVKYESGRHSSSSSSRRLPGKSSSAPHPTHTHSIAASSSPASSSNHSQQNRLSRSQSERKQSTMEVDVEVNHESSNSPSGGSHEGDDGVKQEEGDIFVKIFDQQRQRHYYFNSRTKGVTWVPQPNALTWAEYEVLVHRMEAWARAQAENPDPDPVVETKPIVSIAPDQPRTAVPVEKVKEPEPGMMNGNGVCRMGAMHSGQQMPPESGCSKWDDEGPPPLESVPPCTTAEPPAHLSEGFRRIHPPERMHNVCLEPCLLCHNPLSTSITALKCGHIYHAHCLRARFVGATMFSCLYCGVNVKESTCVPLFFDPKDVINSEMKEVAEKYDEFVRNGNGVNGVGGASSVKTQKMEVDRKVAELKKRLQELHQLTSQQRNSLAAAKRKELKAAQVLNNMKIAKDGLGGAVASREKILADSLHDIELLKPVVLASRFVGKQVKEENANWSTVDLDSMLKVAQERPRAVEKTLQAIDDHRIRTKRVIQNIKVDSKEKKDRLETRRQHFETLAMKLQTLKDQSRDLESQLADKQLVYNRDYREVYEEMENKRKRDQELRMMVNGISPVDHDHDDPRAVKKLKASHSGFASIGMKRLSSKPKVDSSNPFSRSRRPSASPSPVSSSSDSTLGKMFDNFLYVLCVLCCSPLSPFPTFPLSLTPLCFAFIFLFRQSWLHRVCTLFALYSQQITPFPITTLSHLIHNSPPEPTSVGALLGRSVRRQREEDAGLRKGSHDEMSLPVDAPGRDRYDKRFRSQLPGASMLLASKKQRDRKQGERIKDCYDGTGGTRTTGIRGGAIVKPRRM